MDLVELHRRSVEEFTRRARTVHDDQWLLPTPCSEWDVHELVNHIVSEDRWTAPLMRGASLGDVGDRFDGDLLGADPRGAVDDAGADAADSVAEPGVLDRTVHLSFGDAPAPEYVWQLTADHLIHAWDLAAATGADRRLDPDTVSACAGWFAGREDVYRSAGVIGPRREVPQDADPQDLLLAAFGRDPEWRG
ncbi:MAG: TIGR03086 family metal-binding protein [Carbonactinosporaceae bacterium]